MTHGRGSEGGKLVNGVGSQHSSHYLGTWFIQHYYRWCRTPRLPVVDWTDAPAYLIGLVRFAERRTLVSARVPSHFSWSLLVLVLLLIPMQNWEKSWIKNSAIKGEVFVASRLPFCKDDIIFLATTCTEFWCNRLVRITLRYTKYIFFNRMFIGPCIILIVE